MVLTVIGAGALLGALWAWQRRAGRDAVVRVRQRSDPFVDRRSMVRYHAALRPKRR